MKNTRFDFEFRPKSYFGPMSLEHKIRTSIKGEARRRYAAFLLEREGEAAVDGDVLRESLADDEREAQGRIHPALMGGEYLPDFEPGEVEIVRIVLASTTCDVISVRARRVGNRIGYRVCDEYGEKYTCIPKTSAKPLTLRQLIGLLDNANFEGGLPGGVVIGCLRGVSDLESAHKFVTLESIFYPELVPYYRRRIDAWISKERRAIERSKRPVTVAKFLARHGGGYLLAKETLEECAATCEPPRRRKDLFRILDSWVAAQDKPNGPEPGSINIYSRWFLPWSLEILGPTAFRHYRKRNPQGALAIEEWIGKLASEWDARLREKNLGGGLAAQMGAGIARAIVSFARSLGVYEQPSLLHRDQPSQG